LETTRGHRCTAREAHSLGASGPDTDPECLGPRGWGPSRSRFGPRLVSDQHAKSWPRNWAWQQPHSDGRGPLGGGARVQS